MKTRNTQQPETSPGEAYLGQLRSTDQPAAQRGLMGILIALLALLFIVPLTAQLLISVGWLLRGRPRPYSDFVDAANRYEYLEGMIGSQLGIATLILVTLLAVRYLHRERPGGLMSVSGALRWRAVLIAALVAAVVLNAGYWLTRSGEPVGLEINSEVWGWLVVIVLCAPLQAAGEEFLFRGYLPKCLRAIGLAPWLTTILGAVIFALLHGVQDAALFTDRFAFGLFAAIVVLCTGGLEIPIAVHGVNNVFAYGYAALSGGVSRVRHLQTSTWMTTWTNVASYALCFAICWVLVERPWSRPAATY